MEERVEVARSRDGECIQGRVSLLASQGIDYDIGEADGDIVITVAAGERERAGALFALDERERCAADNEAKRIMPEGIRSIIFSLSWLFGAGSLLGIYWGIRGFRRNRFYSLVGILLGLGGLCGALLMLFPDAVRFGGPPDYQPQPVKPGTAADDRIWYVLGAAVLILAYGWVFFGKKKKPDEQDPE